MQNVKQIYRAALEAIELSDRGLISHRCVMDTIRYIKLQAEPLLSSYDKESITLNVNNAVEKVAQIK